MAGLFRPLRPGILAPPGPLRWRPDLQALSAELAKARSPRAHSRLPRSFMAFAASKLCAFLNAGVLYCREGQPEMW